MDIGNFFEKVISSIVGFLLFVYFVLWAINSCSSDNESTSTSKDDKEIVIPKTDEEDTTPSSRSQPREVWEDEWVECVTCHGSGKCHICDGEGVWEIGGSVYKCGCYAGVCGACGGKGGTNIPKVHYEYD